MREQYLLGSCQDAVDRALAEAVEASYVSRIWNRDSSLWKQDLQHRKIIDNALGWLTVAEAMKPKMAEIRAFAETVRKMGYTTACLLGMGGSSLCPEVCATTFGTTPGYLRLQVLDTTDPASIRSAEKSTNLAQTLFLVASKSGGTIESASLHKYFHEKLRGIKGDRAGENFIAITDPGTSLERLAHKQEFLRVFLNPKDIGGRCSALSCFALVPMALIGLDIEAILNSALQVAQACKNTDPAENSGLRLGVTLGALARTGRDKVTFVFAPEISAFGCWLEQLVAESTGKEGVGILPIEGEGLDTAAAYHQDRVFIYSGIHGRRCNGHSHPPRELLVRYPEESTGPGGPAVAGKTRTPRHPPAHFRRASRRTYADLRDSLVTPPKHKGRPNCIPVTSVPSWCRLR